ncbi:hypothetical protein PCH_Pc22g01200 [Penicillium rubens Wisconsin 54-1255]|uniref:Uncharacterized protein n=1 Tax=Penicillium rubens (strain ATCC 28089 / DSM 1075 / NRRL 1951 / Wisconsin 54-1255) TaxID=500485 RepID=B6HP05_PENRW|nr:hypothetical protein PCH_Pc22g01200 [Penicillium rubens Wisconsin 54-1255]
MWVARLVASAAGVPPGDFLALILSNMRGVGGGRSIITSLLAGTTPSNRLTDCGRFLSNKLRSIQAYGVCAFQILLRMGSGKRPRDEVPGLESWSLKSLAFKGLAYHAGLQHTNHDTEFIRLKSDHRATFPAMKRVSQRKQTQFDQSYPIWVLAPIMAGLGGLVSGREDCEWTALNEAKERELMRYWPIIIHLQALSFRHTGRRGSPSIVHHAKRKLRPLICGHPLCDPLRHIPHSPITRPKPVLQEAQEEGVVKDSRTFEPMIGLHYLYPCGSRFSPTLLACVPTPAQRFTFLALDNHILAKCAKFWLSYQRGR